MSIRSNVTISVSLFSPKILTGVSRGLLPDGGRGTLVFLVLVVVGIEAVCPSLKVGVGYARLAAAEAFLSRADVVRMFRPSCFSDSLRLKLLLDVLL